jgi:uncharacterized protein YkwD
MEMMLLALLLQVQASPDLGPIPTTGPPPAAELRELRERLTTRLNKHRADAGLAPLVTDPIAERAAQFQAENMLAAGVMRHLDDTGRTPIARYKAFGGKSDWYGENVGFSSPGVVDPDLVWKDIARLDTAMMEEQPPDDAHRQNILSKHFTAVGIGVAVGPKGVFLCEDFSSAKP